MVTVNNLDAACLDLLHNCQVTYTSAVTPSVVSMRVDHWNGNRTVNITGHALVPPIEVWFGSVPADNRTLQMLNNQHTGFRIAIPPQTAGLTSLFVHTAYGNADNAWTFTYFNRVVVTSITLPSSAAAAGSAAGGTLVVLTGMGFSPTLTRNLVTFGSSGAMAVVVQANYTHLVVKSPPSATTVSTTLSVDVHVSVLDAMLHNVVDTYTRPLAFQYTAALTPVLSYVSPSSVLPGTTLLIEGSKLGASGTVGNAVTIGLVPCTITAWNSTSIACTVDATPAGTHKVLVTVGSQGLALPKSSSSNLAKVSMSLSVTSPSSISVGPGGGASVTLSGHGFASTVAGAMSLNNVTVCGIPVPVTHASSTSLTFLAPVLQTAGANDKYNTYEAEKLIPATVTCQGSGCSSNYIFDGKTSTQFHACSVTADLGQYTVGVVTKIRFYPKYADYGTFQGSYFYGSTTSAAGPYTVLYHVPTTGVLDGWNYYSLPNVTAAAITKLPKYRYLKWSAATNSDCYGMEIEYSGTKLVANEGQSCPVNVTVFTPSSAPFLGAVESASVLAPAPVVVTSVPTAVVTAISPSVGTALGGDLLTIQGRGFTLGSGVENVTLNGQPCKVHSFNATVIHCVTGKRAFMSPPSVQVLVQGVGLALVNDSTSTYFSYLDRWSDLTTWLNNEPPGEGDTVIVPQGQAILVDVSPPRLFLVLVQGEMRFAGPGDGPANNRDLPFINFNASYIFVLGGKLEIGTEAQPLLNQVTITLHGDRKKSIEIPGVGAKTLGVMNTSPGNFNPTTTSAVPANDPGLLLQNAQLAAMQTVMGAEFGQDLNAVSYGSYVLRNSSTATAILTSLLASTAAPNPGAPVPWIERGIIDIHGAPRQRVWTFGNAPAPKNTHRLVTLEPVDYQVSVA